MVIAAVVFPAPVGPAMMYITGIYRNKLINYLYRNAT
jgi:hypothetical protein